MLLQAVGVDADVVDAPLPDPRGVKCSGLHRRLTGGRPVEEEARRGSALPTQIAAVVAVLPAAFASTVQPHAYLLVLPLGALLAVFARERKERIGTAIELSSAYRGTAVLLGDVLADDGEYTGTHSQGLHNRGRSPKTSGRRSTGTRSTDSGCPTRSGETLHDAGDAVRASHKWFDGRGYPDHLRGQQIPLPARIVAVADAWSAMTRVAPTASRCPTSRPSTSCASTPERGSTPRSPMPRSPCWRVSAASSPG